MIVLNNFVRGERRVKELILFLAQKLPISKYQITFASVHQKDVDIWVLDKSINKPYLVIEATNYARTSYIGPSDIKRYIKNLTSYNCYRVIVVSFPENIKTNYEVFVKNNIGIKVMGHQT